MSTAGHADSLLAFAGELERRDAEVARALGAVERLQDEVHELRTRAAAVVAFLASLPAEAAARAAEERAALTARESAEATLREAEAAVARAHGDDERLAAERRAEQARDDLEVAARGAADADEAVRQLEREAGARRAEEKRLAAEAAALSGGVRDLPPPEAGLDGALEWASRARGALLLERAALAGERERVVREASELLGSVLGDPLVAAPVAGVRERLERAIRER